MTESVVDPCTWPVDPGLCCDIPEGTSTELLESTVAEASMIMRTLSGGVVGQCAQTLRPLHQCPTCRSTCCGGADGIPLHGRNGEPVTDVLAVWNGPNLVDPATWWFEDGVLWRVPPARWPSRDPKWQACGDGAAFCIDVLAGAVPDAWALRVASLLVCELIKSCTGQKCRIPRNATSVTAQGVSVTLEPSELAALIPEVAGWVNTINPAGAVNPPQVWSPDLEPSGSTTWGWPWRR